ncbi:MAG: alpha-L-fucosidase [Acidobacteria bacterium]|nr:alpha-L-fucosidase [Acidobacteriota bacterium]MBI3281757.1 alpha-L-fucosidase [Acidobacteriota bacterium]
MKDAKFGVMTHYLADWIARVHKQPMNVEEWNRLVDHFDVEGLARQLESAGVSYYLISIGQNSGYYLSPNATYDRYVGTQPSKCSGRDLVADLYEPLAKRGIKLMVYLPSGAPAGDPVARQALNWQNGYLRNAEFQMRWELVIREWAERWGSRVAGWWFDGCYWPNAMYRGDPPNFATFANAARAGNPDRAIAFNPGVVPRLISMTPYEDYIAGEIDHTERLSIRHASDGKVDGRQIHVLTYMGRTWGMGEPRFDAAEAIQWSKAVTGHGGAITWDVPVERNGRISEPVLDRLLAIGKALGRR